eukprot:TRINITY_DN20243_c0_g1_i2.p2 TRINITY_DN20243_c0_g1~~TRINITY_DN20243_c0_g1_i2.p2  ORF type:complete len:109 (-),score=23.52 TRINITY_DN20243_c0_g1_i2:110-436(-)
MVGKVDVSVTAEFSYSRSETNEKEHTTTTERSHTVTATIPSGKQLDVLMQGAVYTASIPWRGKMYQVDDDGNVIAGTNKDATGFLQSARTATYTVLVKELSASAICSA